MRRGFALLLAIGLSISTYGCGKNNVDYVAGESEAVTEVKDADAKTVTESETEESKGVVGDHIEESYEVNNNTLKIDADVIGRESFGTMPVINISEKSFTEEEMKTYADKLLDPGYKAVYYYSREEAVGDPDSFKDEGIKWYHFEDPNGVYESFDYCSIEGKRDGVDTILSFERHDGCDGMFFGSIQKSRYGNMANVINLLTGQPGSETANNNTSANKGGLTVGEVTEITDSFLSELDMKEFKSMGVFDLSEGSLTGEYQNESTGYDGYMVVYHKDYDGFTEPYDQDSIYYNYAVSDVETGEIVQMGYENLIVFVREGKVFAMTYACPVQTDKITTDVNVTDLETLYKCAVDELKNSDRLKTEDCFVKEIRVGYARISDPDDPTKMSLVPALYYYADDWLTGYDPVGFYRTTAIIINAIDGSPIVKQGGLG